MKFLSTISVGALVASAGAVVLALSPVNPAAAADLPNGIHTNFEIDGNTAGVNDWEGVVGHTPTAPYGTSTGIIDAQRSSDSGANYTAHTCGGTETSSVFPGGAKIDDNPTVALINGTANAKGDACTGGSAYEVVTVGGVPHTIFYTYWTRLSGNGDMTSYEIFQGPEPGRGDDYLIEFNYDPAGTPTTDVNVLKWDGSKWVDTGTTVYFQAAVGANTDTNASSGDNDTFGEMAIDLTASGLMPNDGACRTFLDAGFITRTGNKQTATLQDMLVASDPLTITNCGGLVVKKASNPAGQTAGGFSYVVDRTGGGQVHDSTLTGPTDTVAGNAGLGATIAVGDTHTWGNVFAGQDYRLTETTPSVPWQLQSTVCTVTNPTSHQVETYTNQAFKLYVGATTTCVITNATSFVKVTKIAQGDPTTFDYTVNGAPLQVAGGASSSLIAFTPGTPVTIDELDEPGQPAWHLMGIVCTGSSASVNLAAGTASFTTVAGQTIECTYTNRQDGAIRIVKAVQGAGGDFTFTRNFGTNFTLSPGANGTAMTDFASVTPGSYTVTETTPAPAFDLTGLVCTDDVAGGTASSTVVATGVSTINVDPGELVTCTYTNTQRGTIIVDKVTNPVGSPTSFGFGLGGPDTDPAGNGAFSLTDAAAPKVFSYQKPGVYTLTEADLDGWDPTSMTCTGEAASDTDLDGVTTFTLQPGETVTCTVLNTATKGKVTVTKSVPGMEVWGPFAIELQDAPAGQVNPQNVSNVDPVAEWTDLVVGQTYTLVEPTVAGWTTEGFTCNVGTATATGWTFTVTPGLEVSCTIVNVPVPGQVTVTKTVAGVAAGTAWSFDLTISPSAGVLPSATQEVSGVGNTTDSVTWTNLAVGQTYTITEDLPDGWTGGAVDCAGPDADPATPGDQFTVTPGLVLSCTVRNEASPASAKVTKTSVGAAGTFTFVLTPLNPPGAPIEQTVTTPIGGGTGATTFAGLVPGTTYSIDEQDPGAGWVAGTLQCSVEHADGSGGSVTESSFTVLAGDVFDCDITNTANARIVIVKQVDGANMSFSFQGTWAGASLFQIPTVAGTGSKTFENVTPGSYTVTEVLPSAYTGTLLSCVEERAGGADGGSSAEDLVGTIDLDPGETVTCTYSNTELASITVDKVVPGAGSIPGGATTQFDFELDGDASDTFSLTDGATPYSTGLVEPGEYSVTELAEANWSLADLQCVGTDGENVEIDDATATIQLGAGEHVTCTYTNVPDTGDVSVRKIVTDVPDGYPFEFTISITPTTGLEPDRAQEVNQDETSVSWSGLQAGVQYTIAEDDADGWTEGSVTCTGAGEDLADGPAFSFIATPGISVTCTVTNTPVRGSVQVTKSVQGLPEGQDWSFEIGIDPVPDYATEPIGPQDSPQTVTDDEPVIWWDNLEIGETYTLSEVEVPEGWTGGDITCNVGEAGEGGTWSFTVTPGLEVICSLENTVVAPVGEILKELLSAEQQADGTWFIDYRITVTNQSPVVPLVYDLADQPFYGLGSVITASEAGGPDGPIASWDQVGPDVESSLAEDASVPAGESDVYTLHIEATVPAVVFQTGQDQCAEGSTTNGGFRNTAFLTWGEDGTDQSSDCDEPGMADMTKTLSDEPSLVTDPGDPNFGDWIVEYDVVVTNDSGKDLFYDLSDVPGFPDGVVITASATTDAPGADVSGWNGDDVTVLVDDQPIAAAGEGGPTVHTFHITVIADVVDITEIDDVQCVAETSGHGFFNGAEMVSGTIVDRDDDCVDIPIGRIQLLKTVDNSAFDGLDLEALAERFDVETLTLLESSDWNVSGSLFEGDDPANPLLRFIEERGDQGIVFTVPLGNYRLAEQVVASQATHPLLSYYQASGWSCDDLDPADAIGTVVLGALTSCSLENRAVLVDVGIEKSYDLGEGGDGAVEAGDSFDYVLEVTNNGTLDVGDLDVEDLLDEELVPTGPAVFTDELGDPDSDWTQTSDVTANAFTAHGVGPFAPGHVVTITIPVRMVEAGPTPTPDVVGPDDPAPVVEPVDLDDIPNEACVAITAGEGALADLDPTNDCSEVEVPKQAIDSGAYVRCVNDVPWLYYDIQVSDSVEPGPITVTWTSADGTLTKEETIPFDELSGRLLWPGAEVDENGIPFVFPGWRPITEEDLVNPPFPGDRFLDLILDENVATYPWRGEVVTVNPDGTRTVESFPATVTFSINPSQSVLAIYPQALPSCEIERPPLVDIQKTASVSSAAPGSNFTYTLKVAATGTGAATPVEIFDEIPADIKVNSINTAGAPAFPRWEGCQVTGANASGYGGVLHCTLLGVLGPDYPTAPDVTLGVTVNPSTKVTSIANTGEVCYSDSEDTAVPPTTVCDESTVTVSVPQPLAATGFGGALYAWGAGALTLLGGLVVALTVLRRRRVMARS